MKSWKERQNKFKNINIMSLCSWLIAIIGIILSYYIASSEMILSYACFFWAMEYGIKYRGNIYRITKIMWGIYILILMIPIMTL